MSAVGIRIRELFEGATMDDVPGLIEQAISEHSRICVFYNTADRVLAKIPPNETNPMNLIGLVGDAIEAEEKYCLDSDG